MQTRCPECHTLFRLREEHLQIAGGRVRCGRCGRLFDARPEATEPAPSPAAAAPNEAAEPPLPEALQSTRPHRRSPLWALGALLLLVAALGQMAWWGRDYLVKLPEGRHLLEPFCAHLGCELPPQRDPEQLRIETRAVSAHPELEGILRIRMTFVNRAEFVQPYPLLQVTFFRDEVQPAVQRTFRPEEYLKQPADARALLLPGQMVYVELDVEDPGEEVSGFQFEFY